MSFPQLGAGSLRGPSPSGALAEGNAALRQAARPRALAAGKRQAQAPRAQALSSWDADDSEASKRSGRGAAAGPVRVFTPLQEASAPSALPDFMGGERLAFGDAPAAGPAVSIDGIMRPVVADMESCRQNLLNVVGERHPLLLAAADQIFSAGGKRLRPLIVFLVARATYPVTGLSDITERHRRLAEITEMIHTASLVHDDVLDECDIRRGRETVNSLFGTRVAVLAGDFLFAQSSWFLANLDNLEVIKLISQVIADFADGEISQAASLFDVKGTTLQRYLDKSFYKTASLVAASCRSSAVFSDCDVDVKEAMYAYGKHLGLAFQVVDDILDFTQSTKQLGKPQGQDLASGNLTAPAIFALEHPVAGPELRRLIEGRFKDEGSLQSALELVQAGGGIARAQVLAREEGDLALAALSCLPDTPAKRSLEMMVDYVLERIY